MSGRPQMLTPPKQTSLLLPSCINSRLYSKAEKYSRVPSASTVRHAANYRNTDRRPYPSDCSIFVSCKPSRWRDRRSVGNKHTVKTSSASCVVLPPPAPPSATATEQRSPAVSAVTICMRKENDVAPDRRTDERTDGRLI